jgi:DNA-binding transcriptional MocR family regulator
MEIAPMETPNNRRPFLYRRISQKLIDQIRAGSYAVGERLPSVRDMSRIFDVINTVIQSYRQLEVDGWLDARPQSGFFVRHAGLDGVCAESDGTRYPLVPVEVSMSERVLQYMALYARPDVVRLGLALPGAEVMPIRRIMKLFRNTLLAHEQATWEYMHPHGYPPLLHHLARRSLGHEVPVASEDIIITSGCMEALVLALACVSRPGDAIVVESPTYYGTLLLLEAHGRRVIEVPAHHRTGICLDTLEQVLAQGRVAACMVTANAQNPLGYTMPVERKRALVALAARHGVPLIENDVWGDLVYQREQALPLKAFDKEGLVLYCNSFSKTLVPGFRLGWCAPGRFHHRFRELKQLSTITSASAPQIAIAQMLESGFYEQHLRTLRHQLKRQAVATAQLILQHFPAGTRVSAPSGGCVLWVRLPGRVDADLLFEHAAAEAIHVFPGSIFSAHDGHAHYLRINAGSPISFRIRTALRRLGALVAELITAGRQANDSGWAETDKKRIAN